jgi:hypothetical protein
MKGMITYTKEFRNFSVVSKDDQGRFYSECYVYLLNFAAVSGEQSRG